MQKTTMKRVTHLRVPVLPEEAEEIKKRAAQAGKSVAAYLRTVGMSYPVRSVVDNEKVLEMAQISADLGRLGGLLKLWLTNDKKVMEFGDIRMRGVIRTTLSRILENQDKLKKLMSDVVRS